VMRSANGMMELHRQGRDFTDNSAIALKGDPETLLWAWVGEVEEVRRSDERTAILKALEGAPDGMTPQEIADMLDKKSGAIRYLLHKMMHADDGCITKVKDRYVTTTNGTNNPNDSPSKQPGSRKQANSQGTSGVSGGISGPYAGTNANAGTNAQKPLDFEPEGAPVSGVSDVSSAEASPGDDWEAA
jgi:hypothetical protein